MLLRFTVRNHLSLRDSQELSLVASSISGKEEGLLDGAVNSDERYLPALVIYGANASGKSNVILAMRFLRSSVLLSHSQGGPNTAIPSIPFALDQSASSRPTELSIDFIVDGVRYHYGFTCLDNRFESEWLYSFARGRQTKLFERDKQNFEFGRSLRGRNLIISELTRPNSLFFSAALQNDHRELTKIGSFFLSMHADESLNVSSEIAAAMLENADVDHRSIDFLGKIGTGIVDYRKQERLVPETVKELNAAFSAALKQIAKNREYVDFPIPEKTTSLELAHRATDSRKVFFELARESAGTRRLMMLLSPIFSALDRGSCVLVDELNASLHTLACEAVLALFCDRQTNPHGAQLITTTHDTNLLRSPFLRRDQIWFAEKDYDGATTLYPLTDIRTRQTDNLEKGYLQGRFGAVPFSGSVKHLLSEIENA